jgi:1-acyl-sn-glycerol-3-phosphate acyltransferase
MIYTEYPQNFAEKDEYKTEQAGRPFFPSLRFYPKLFKIVWDANRKAVKGVYDGINHTWASYLVFRALESVGVRFHVKGLRNLYKMEGPVVFVANHMSTLETVAIECFIYPVKPVVYIIKEELMRYPIFGKVVSANHPIPVSRKDPRGDLLNVLAEGKKRLADGYSIIIFPQKTREIFLNLKSFNSLGVKLAQRSDVGIIPIAIKSDAWANGRKIKELGKIDPNKPVKIEFGEPFKVNGNSSEAHNRVLKFIEEKFIEWGMEDKIIK